MDEEDFPGDVIPLPGDTLVSIDGITADSTAFMAYLVRRVEIGATVTLTYLRGGDGATVEAIARPLPVTIVRYLIITQIFVPSWRWRTCPLNVARYPSSSGEAAI